jgi:hypothetical protein
VPAWTQGRACSSQQPLGGRGVGGIRAAAERHRSGWKGGTGSGAPRVTGG